MESATVTPEEQGGSANGTSEEQVTKYSVCFETKLYFRWKLGQTRRTVMFNMDVHNFICSYYLQSLESVLGTAGEQVGSATVTEPQQEEPPSFFSSVKVCLRVSCFRLSLE